MHTFRCENWGQFKDWMGGYSALSPERKRQLIFRGQANAEWPLETTLDRSLRNAAPGDRSSILNKLLVQFRRCALGLGVSLPEWSVDDTTTWELLARHHGVPTTVLDWTQSPWFAAFFAIADPVSLSATDVAVWFLDRDIFVEHGIEDIEIIDDVQFFGENIRAIEQESLFMQVRGRNQTIEEYVAAGLNRFTIPSSNRSVILAELDDMGINRRSLFRDLDGAASTATLRTFAYVLGE